MATPFENMMAHGLRVMRERLAESATLYKADGSASQTVQVIFNEQVGFVDNRRRAVWTMKGSDLTTGDINRGDYFVLDGETDQWTVVDVRDDKSGGIEVRADGALERL